MAANIAVITCLILAIFGMIICKRWFNPVTLFSALWCVIFFLASMELYNLNEAADSTYYNMLLGMITFSIGFYFWYIVRRKFTFSFKLYSNSTYVKEYEINYKLLYFVCYTIILFNLSTFISSISVLFSGGGLDAIRYIAQNSNTSASRTISNVINNLIVSPFSLAILPITAMDIIAGKRDKKLILFTIIIILTKLLGDGGRAQALYFIIHLVIIFLFLRKNLDIRISKRTKRILMMIMTGIVVVITIASLSRSGGNLRRFTYYYFSMQLTMFEQWTEEIGGLMGYGEGSLNGLMFPFIYIFKNIFKLSYPEHWNAIYELIQRTDSEWKIIAGQYIKANAYVSLFWFFYLDARVWGIGLLSGLYGMFCGGKFADVIKRPSLKVICIYSFVLQGLLFSFVRFQFATMAYALGFIYLCFLGFKKKKIN